jgi:hypothetical protein
MFIKQLEDDAIVAKRIAKDARKQNKVFDKRVDDEEQHIHIIKSKFKKSIME